MLPSPLQYFAKTAFLSDRWAENVLISVDHAGWIEDIKINQQSNSAIQLNGALLPGMLNVHSHAFQYALAGLTERGLNKQENFWTWREMIYKFLEKLTPEDLNAIAAQVYVEMLKAGFTTVGEFHYILHQPNGKFYEKLTRTSDAIIKAALEVGIATTHLPVLYAFNGFGGENPTQSQRRFLTNENQILTIISDLIASYQNNPQITIGFAPHSLRAVTPHMLQNALQAIKQINPQSPIHIHIAEQMKEVNDCISWSKQRPVEWLLNHVDVNRNWCLIHATHMTDSETQNLCVSGAVVGLCPTTEANLGDGFFNLPKLISNNGKFSVGSDSNISVSMIEELRLLEYGQRLLRQERAVTKLSEQISIGRALYCKALSGGAQALGRKTGAIEVGKRADFIVLDLENPALLCKTKDFIFDAMIFACNTNPIRHVIVGGKHIVKDFYHLEEEKILQQYKKILAKLIA